MDNWDAEESRTRMMLEINLHAHLLLDQDLLLKSDIITESQFHKKHDYIHVASNVLSSLEMYLTSIFNVEREFLGCLGKLPILRMYGVDATAI
jgi:hypothetical protein